MPLGVGCGDAPPRALSELVVRDSTYFDPLTIEPYSGPVFAYFPEGQEAIQMEGTLRDGTWNGELTVYHRSGRVRYQGEMADGAQCGGWLEQEDDSEPADAYDAIRRELNALVIYGDCP